MKKFSKNLNLILIVAIFVAAVLTWIAPVVIRVLFTPPVSFGTNCEPAATWSMQKLVWTQLIGFILGVLATMTWLAARPSDRSGGGSDSGGKTA